MPNLKDGAKMELVLQHGPSQKQVSGTLRSFRPNSDQIVELETKVKELKDNNDLRWEIIPTGSDSAVGFLAEHVIEAKPLKMN